MPIIPAGELRGLPYGDPDVLRHVWTIVGHLVVSFGLLEFGLDWMTAIAHKNGGDVISRKLPIPFSERTKFISNCADRLPILASHRDRLKNIAAKADGLAAIRNDVIHGYIAEYDEQANHLLTFAK